MMSALDAAAAARSFQRRISSMVVDAAIPSTDGTDAASTLDASAALTINTFLLEAPPSPGFDSQFRSGAESSSSLSSYFSLASSFSSLSSTSSFDSPALSTPGAYSSFADGGWLLPAADPSVNIASVAVADSTAVAATTFDPPDRILDSLPSSTTSSDFTFFSLESQSQSDDSQTSFEATSSSGLVAAPSVTLEKTVRGPSSLPDLRPRRPGTLRVDRVDVGFDELLPKGAWPKGNVTGVAEKMKEARKINSPVSPTVKQALREKLAARSPTTPLTPSLSIFSPSSSSSSSSSYLTFSSTSSSRDKTVSTPSTNLSSATSVSISDEKRSRPLKRQHSKSESEIDDSELKNRREKNRIAANRCRQRKQAHQVSLEARCDRLEKEYEEKLNLVKNLEAEKRKLQQIVLEHDLTCNCTTARSRRSSGEVLTQHGIDNVKESFKSFFMK